MNQQRWVAHGRASECFVASEDLIKLDIAMRELGISYICKDIIENRLEKETKDYLEAYVEGVNFFRNERKEFLNSLRYFQLATGLISFSLYLLFNLFILFNLIFYIYLFIISHHQLIYYCKETFVN